MSEEVQYEENAQQFRRQQILKDNRGEINKDEQQANVQNEVIEEQNYESDEAFKRSNQIENKVGKLIVEKLQNQQNKINAVQVLTQNMTKTQTEKIDLHEIKLQQAAHIKESQQLPHQFENSKQLQQPVGIDINTQPQITQQKPIPNIESHVYTLQQRIDDSIEMKNIGNDFYKKSDFNNAIQSYYQGLRILDPNELNKGTVDIIQQSRSIVFTLINNIAQTQIKLGNYQQAILCCSEVLQSQPRNIKALYKRANSYFEIGKLEEALKDIKLAYEIDPTSREGIQAYRKIGKAFEVFNKQRRQEQKQLYKNMFNKQQKQQKTDKQKQILTTQQQFPILKSLIFGSLSAAGAYFMSKYSSSHSIDISETLSIAGSGVSGSLLALPGIPSKVIGGLGLVVVGAFLYSRK